MIPFGAQAEISFCKAVSEAAESAMNARQNGVPASELIEELEEGLIDQPNYMDFTTEIVKSAFDVTRYDTEKDKQIAIEEFSSAFFLACHNVVKDYTN